MPSITFWNRLEPRPRSRSVRRALAARVRDPLWFLTRQWQFGEFQGEDAASPARVECEATFAPIDQWRTTGAEPHDFDFDNSAPLEAVVESEPFTPDLATAVELGQKFESLLRKDGLSDLISEFRKAFPFPLPSENLNREQTGNWTDSCKCVEDESLMAWSFSKKRAILKTACQNNLR